MSNYITPVDLDEKYGAQAQFISTVTRWSWVGLIIVSVVQLVFFFHIQLLIALVAVIVAWMITLQLFLKPSTLNHFPLSSFLIIGFSSTQFYFPVFFTTLEGKPLTYNLDYVEEVFLHNILALLVLILSHLIYRAFAPGVIGSRPLASKIGLFDPPSATQLWIMGLIGVGATLYTYFTSIDVYSSTTGAPGDKFIQGLMPLTYAPYFILTYKLYGGRKPYGKKVFLFLAIFTIILFAVSIGRNSRAAFMFGFTSLALTYCLGLMIGIYKNKIFTVRTFALASIFVWLLTGPVADLGTAMVIVRGEREEIPASELVTLTLDAFSDKEAIRQRREQDRNELPDDGWDERYLDNVFTARFSNLKFNDLSLQQFYRLSEFDPDMLQYAQDYIVGALPDPLIKLFGFDVDKETIYGISTGDFIYLLAGGTGYPGGFRMGHFAGTGMAMFGWWYLGILGVGMLLIFVLFDFLCRSVRSHDHSGYSVQFSCYGLLTLTTIFQFLPNESVISIVPYVLRGWLQMLILYLIALYIGKFVDRILTLARRVRISSDAA